MTTDRRALCAQLVESYLAQREEVLGAFIAKHGFCPDEAIQIEQRLEDGSSTWRIERRAALSQPEPEGLTDEEIEKRFQRWWFNEGSGMRPSNGEDQEEHTRRVSQIAWSNGAYVARWGRPAVEPEPEDKVLARVEFAKGDFNGPFDAALAQYCDNWFYGDPERTEVDPVDLCRGAIKLFAQALAPTPVSGLTLKV